MTMTKELAMLMVLFFLALSGTGHAATGHGHASAADKKIGILLVAFGSSEASVRWRGIPTWD